MKRKRISFLTALVLCFVLILPVKVMAAEPPQLDNNVKYADMQACGMKDEIQPKNDGHYYWVVDSITSLGTDYGSWRLGPQGAGPGTITVNKTDTVTNTISGSYTSVGAIAASLGVSIGQSQSYSVQYSLPVPAGRIYQIKYRPLFTKYRVIQRQYYRLDGSSIPTSETKTCYVNVFYDWGFSYNVIQ